MDIKGFKTPKLRKILSQLIIKSKNVSRGSEQALLKIANNSQRNKLEELYNTLTKSKKTEKITAGKFNKKETEVQLLPKYIATISNRLISLLPSGSATFKFNNYKIDELKTIQLIIKLVSKILKNGEHVTIKAGNTHYTLNNNTKDKLLESIKNQIKQGEESMESDAQIVYAIQEVGSITVSVNLIKNFGKTKKGGAYFSYYNKTSLDLSRYQIFNNNKNANYDDNCIIYALRNGGLDEVSLNKIKLFCKTREIPQCKLNDICENIGIQIILKQDDKHKENNKYGTTGTIYNIGLLNKHYFINEDINVSTYCIKNYSKVKDQDNYYHITEMNGKYYKRNKNIMSSSFNVIKQMLINKEQCLEDITITDDNLSNIFSDKPTEIINLNYNDSSCKLLEIKEEPKEQKITYSHIWFFDFETYQDKEGKHLPYLLCAINNDNDNIVNFYGLEAGKKFLDTLTDNTILIAHNADYDFRFMIKYFFSIEEIVRETSFMSAKALYYNWNLKKTINIKIKCSLRMINMPLHKFPKCFLSKDEQKTYKKEIMPYDLYNEKTICTKFIDIDYATKFIRNDSDKIEFINNINLWKLNINGKFNIIEYARIYCEMDCILLKKGYNVFRGWMITATGLDINNIISLASLADKYLINRGCYDDIYQLSGVPQVFIMKCVVGGRTMTRDNKSFEYDGEQSDFDAVSLYPSAMSRMGFLIGKPKIITSTNWNDIKDYDGLFLQIKINKIGVKRHFPLLSYLDENTGVRNFTNDMIGRNVYVDKITLEDAIKFQEIEFDIIRGYYFDQGFNYKIKEVITELFNERKKKKAEKNPIQIVYKEILNSAYGKTIMKATNIDTKYINGKENFEKYFDKNYNYIHSYEVIDGTENGKENRMIYRLKTFIALNEHFNRPQVGSSILAMSKRIMNEVMSTAEDANIIINYQDTDSMHVEADKINLLSKLFYDKYDRQLIGEEMGQFHSDFDLEGAENIIATKSIFLGKKSYIDILEGDSNNGKINGFHMRLKGIPEASIEHYCETNSIGKYELYNQLLNKQEIKFDLLCGKYDVDGVSYTNKPKFKRCTDKSISSLKEFNRVLNKVKLTDAIICY